MNIKINGFVGGVICVTLAAISAPAGAQYRQDNRTANSTPPVYHYRQSLPERAIEQQMRRQAWREGARYAGRRGYEYVGRGARWVSRRRGLVGEFLRPNRACAPAHVSDCR